MAMQRRAFPSAENLADLARGTLEGLKRFIPRRGHGVVDDGDPLLAAYKELEEKVVKGHRIDVLEANLALQAVADQLSGIAVETGAPPPLPLGPNVASGNGVGLSGGAGATPPTATTPTAAAMSAKSSAGGRKRAANDVATVQYLLDMCALLQRSPSGLLQRAMSDSTLVSAALRLLFQPRSKQLCDLLTTFVLEFVVDSPALLMQCVTEFDAALARSTSSWSATESATVDPAAASGPAGLPPMAPAASTAATTGAGGMHHTSPTFSIVAMLLLFRVLKRVQLLPMGGATTSPSSGSSSSGGGGGGDAVRNSFLASAVRAHLLRVAELCITKTAASLTGVLALCCFGSLVAGRADEKDDALRNPLVQSLWVHAVSNIGRTECSAPCRMTDETVIVACENTAFWAGELIEFVVELTTAGSVSLARQFVQEETGPRLLVAGAATGAGSGGASGGGGVGGAVVVAAGGPSLGNAVGGGGGSGGGGGRSAWRSLPGNWDALLSSGTMPVWRLAASAGACLLSVASSDFLLTAIAALDVTDRLSEYIYRGVVAYVLLLCRASPLNAHALCKCDAFRRVISLMTVGENGSVIFGSDASAVSVRVSRSVGAWSMATALLSTLAISRFAREELSLLLGAIDKMLDVQYSDTTAEDCEVIEHCANVVSGTTYTSYYWFDGLQSKASIPVEKFVGRWYGYSFASWILPSCVWPEGGLLYAYHEATTPSTTALCVVADGPFFNLAIRTSNNKEVTITVLPDTQFEGGWAHIAVVHNISMNIFINGRKRTTGTIKAPYPTTPDKPHRLTFYIGGADAEVKLPTFFGMMAAATFYEGVLADKDIDRLCSAGPAGFTSVSVPALPLGTAGSPPSGGSSGGGGSMLSPAAMPSSSALQVAAAEATNGAGNPGAIITPPLSSTPAPASLTSSGVSSTHGPTAAIPNNGSSLSATGTALSNNNSVSTTTPAVAALSGAASGGGGGGGANAIAATAPSQQTGTGGVVPSLLSLVAPASVVVAPLVVAPSNAVLLELSPTEPVEVTGTLAKTDYIVVRSVLYHSVPSVAQAMVDVDLIGWASRIITTMSASDNKSSVAILTMQFLVGFLKQCREAVTFCADRRLLAHLGAALRPWSEIPPEVVCTILQLAVKSGKTFRAHPLTTATLNLVLDLIQAELCPLETRIAVLKDLGEQFLGIAENARIFREAPGLAAFLQCCLNFPTECISDVVAVVEKVVKEPQEMDHAFRFLIFEPINARTVVFKCELLRMFYDVSKPQPQIMDVILNANGVNSLLLLAHGEGHSSESLRVYALRVLSLVLHCNKKHRETFLRAGGFELLGVALTSRSRLLGAGTSSGNTFSSSQHTFYSTLGSMHVGLQTYNCLFKMALDAFRPNVAAHGSVLHHQQHRHTDPGAGTPVGEGDGAASLQHHQQASFGGHLPSILPRNLPVHRTVSYSSIGSGECSDLEARLSVDDAYGAQSSIQEVLAYPQCVYIVLQLVAQSIEAICNVGGVPNPIGLSSGRGLGSKVSGGTPKTPPTPPTLPATLPLSRAAHAQPGASKTSDEQQQQQPPALGDSFPSMESAAAAAAAATACLSASGGLSVEAGGSPLPSSHATLSASQGINNGSGVGGANNRQPSVGSQTGDADALSSTAEFAETAQTDVLRVMSYLARMLAMPHNAAAFLANPWLEWIWSSVGSIFSSPVADQCPHLTKRLVPIVRGILRNLVVVDLSRQPKQMTAKKVKEMTDSPLLQQILIEEVMRHFSANTRDNNTHKPLDVIDAAEAGNVLRNMETLLLSIDECVFPLPQSLVVEIVNGIDSIAMEANRLVRKQMKSGKLFEIRDRLAAHALLSVKNLSTENQDHVSALVRANMGDPNATVHLLKLFCDAVRECNLLTAVGAASGASASVVAAQSKIDALQGVLRMFFASDEEHRKTIGKLVADPEACEVLVGQRKVVDGVEIPVEGATMWIRSHEPRWEGVVSRVVKANRSIESDIANRLAARDKEFTTKTKARKAETDRRLQLQSRVASDFERVKQDVLSRAKGYTDLVAEVANARRQREFDLEGTRAMR